MLWFDGVRLSAELDEGTSVGIYLCIDTSQVDAAVATHNTGETQYMTHFEIMLRLRVEKH